MSPSTLSRTPSLFSTSRTVPLSALDVCRVTCAWTSLVLVLSATVVVSAVAEVVAVEASAAGVAAAEVVVALETVVAVVAVEALLAVAVAVVPVTLEPRSRLIKRGLFEFRTEGFVRVYHYSGLCGLSFQNKLNSIVESWALRMSFQRGAMSDLGAILRDRGLVASQRASALRLQAF